MVPPPFPSPSFFLNCHQTQRLPPGFSLLGGNPDEFGHRRLAVSFLRPSLVLELRNSCYELSDFFFQEGPPLPSAPFLSLLEIPLFPNSCLNSGHFFFSDFVLFFLSSLVDERPPSPHFENVVDSLLTTQGLLPLPASLAGRVSLLRDSRLECPSDQPLPFRFLGPSCSPLSNASFPFAPIRRVFFFFLLLSSQQDPK